MFILIYGKDEYKTSVQVLISVCFIELSPGLTQVLPEDPESSHPSTSNPVLDAPEFPDFENSEAETKEGDTIDIAALELEALTLVRTDLPVPFEFGVTDFEEPHPDSSVCHPAEPSVSSVDHDLNLGSQSIIPLDPAGFPEPTNLLEFIEPVAPRQWSQSEDMIVDSSNFQADENDLGASECHSAPEETELSNHAVLKNGIQQYPR